MDVVRQLYKEGGVRKGELARHIAFGILGGQGALDVLVGREIGGGAGAIMCVLVVLPVSPCGFLSSPLTLSSPACRARRASLL
jgi:hypothetical protein